MRNPSSFARRFIAGESVDEAIEAARQVEARGMLVSLDLLGESVASHAEAAKATREYQQVIDEIVDAGVERNISLKLTQLGLEIDRATATDNLRRILDLAARHDFFVRIDMENSPYTERDARDLRDAVAARLSERGRGAPVGAEAQRAGHAAGDRASARASGW